MMFSEDETDEETPTSLPNLLKSMSLQPLEYEWKESPLIGDNMHSTNTDYPPADINRNDGKRKKSRLEEVQYTAADIPDDDAKPADINGNGGKKKSRKKEVQYT